MKKVVSINPIVNVVKSNDVTSTDIVVLWRDDKPHAKMVKVQHGKDYRVAFSMFESDSWWNGLHNSVEKLLNRTISSTDCALEVRVYDTVKEMMLDCAKAYY